MKKILKAKKGTANPGAIVMALALGGIPRRTATNQNVGGCTGRIRYCAISDFLSIAAKLEMSDPAATANIDLVEISDDHTFATGKGFFEAYVTRDTGKVDFTMNQERDTTGASGKYEAITPGAKSATHAELLLLANQSVIVLVELASGEWVQMGSERFPAEVKYNWSSENNGKGERGWKFSVENFDTSIAYYTGTITMHP